MSVASLALPPDGSMMRAYADADAAVLDRIADAYTDNELDLEALRAIGIILRETGRL